MTHEYQRKVAEINKKLNSIDISANYFQISGDSPRGSEAIQKLINQELETIDSKMALRLKEEFFGFGPLKNLLQNDDITEIIVNNFNSVWVEIGGILQSSSDTFLSSLTYDNFLQRLYLEIGQEPTLINPFIDSFWLGHRLHIIGPYSSDQPWVRVTLRKHKGTAWSLSELQEKKWAYEDQIRYLKQIVNDKKNFMVVGPTGSGKTSVLKAMLQQCQAAERVVVLEDTREIGSPTLASTQLITRADSRDVLSNINLSDLVRQSLRMRPDRIVIGEVRGGEAKDLLLALATGHHGSAGTLHAANPQQALIRLEMLIQMGASHWSLLAVRRLIQMSLDYLIVCGRTITGQRRLEGIYKIVSLEDSGLIIEEVLFTERS